MKLFGYRSGVEEDIPMELAAVALVAKPEVLRMIADLLLDAADEIEVGAVTQIRLQDYWSEWEEAYPDFIVAQKEEAVNPEQ